MPGNGLSAEDLVLHMAHIMRSDDIDTAWNRVVDAFREMGFRHLIYGYSPDARGEALGSVEDALILSTLGRRQTVELIRYGYHQKSPSMLLALRRPGVFSWSTPAHDLPEDISFVRTPAVREFLSYHGLHSGCTVGFARGGRGAGVLALVGDAPVSQADLDRWLPLVDEAIFVLASVAHRTLSLLPWERPAGGLTQRQREVLEWVGEGKLTADIACILGVTPATVEKHLRLARQCLDVETTAHALVKAGFLNQVFVRGRAAAGRGQDFGVLAGDLSPPESGNRDPAGRQVRKCLLKNDA